MSHVIAQTAPAAKLAMLNGEPHFFDTKEMPAQATTNKLKIDLNKLTFNPRQMAHILFHQGETFVRTAQPFGQKADITKFFNIQETRPFLERFAPCQFVVASFVSLKAAMAATQDGLFVESLNLHLKVVTTWVKPGEGATCILIDSSLPYELKDFNIDPKLEKATDVGKFMKYQKRLCAMYKHFVFGSEARYAKDKHGDYMTYFVENQQFKVRFMSALPADFKIEGCAFVTPEFANAHFGKHPDTGKKWKKGDTARITFQTPEWMWKGHVMVWEMKRVQATFWDCKKQIGLNDDSVFVGFMGSLHSGKLHMNVQSVGNFGLQQFMVEFGKAAMRSYMETQLEPQRALDLFLANYGQKLDEITMGDDNDGITAAQIERWRFMSAVKHGFDYHSEPFMQRDDFRNFTRKIVDATNGRVPVPETSGFAAYYFIDPWTITDDGLFDPEGKYDQHGNLITIANRRFPRKRLNGNTVYTSRVASGTEIVMFRDPQTRHEYQIAFNAAPHHGDPLIDPNCTAVSCDIAMRFAEAQGGGDFDDRGNHLFDPRIVEHFKNNLPAYPAKMEFPAPAKVRDILTDNVFIDLCGWNKVIWDRVAMADKLRAADEADAGVGSIINYLMLCTDLSFYLPQYQQELVDMGLRKLKVRNAHHFLTTVYKRYDENDLQSALEDAIDGMVMNGAKGDTNYASLGERIKEFFKILPCVPYWATVGGSRGTGRVPQSCMKNKPVILEGPMSAALRELQALARQMEDWLIVRQWRGMKVAPAEIRNYRVIQKVRKAAYAGQSKWNLQMRALREQSLNDEANYAAFIGICEEHLAELNELSKKNPDYAFQYLAVLEANIHNGPKLKPEVVIDEKTGEQRMISPRDAYLNNPRFFPIRVALHKSLGLKKELYPVKLYPGAATDGRITVHDGRIYMESALIGADTAIPDGFYDMSHSLIRF